MKGKLWKKALAACLALLLVSGGVPIQPFTDIFSPVAITASATDYTDFLTVSSSGTATGYFTYNNHFYKVYWFGINTTKTTTVKLIYGDNNNIRARINNNSSGFINLYFYQQ